MLSVYFQTAGEFLIGDLRMAIPFAAIEPLLDRFSSDSATAIKPGAMQATVAATVRNVPLNIAVELGSARIRLRQLLDLQAGDVIPLQARLGQPAIVPVQGKPKFTAHIGRIGNRLGIQVADVMGG